MKKDGHNADKSEATGPDAGAVSVLKEELNFKTLLERFYQTYSASKADSDMLSVQKGKSETVRQ